IFFASQTGNAESIAQSIHKDSLSRGFPSTFAVLNDFQKLDLGPNPAVLFVASTTGDGDPPDNAIKFWRALRKLKTAGELPWKHVRATVLGLGDTNYDNFCNTGKRLVKKLKELGAELFYEPAFADDATGLEATVDPWIEGLWKALADNVVCSKDTTTATDADAANVEEKTPEATPVPFTEAATPVNGVATDVAADVDTKVIEKKLETVSISGPAIAAPVPLILDDGILKTVTSVTGTPKVPAAACVLEPVADSVVNGETIALSDSNNSSTSNDIPSFLLTTPTPYVATMFTGKLVDGRQITTDNAVKRALQVTIDISSAPDGTASYVPGDAFGIIAPNPADEVIDILRRCGVSETDIYRQHRISTASATDALPSHLARAGTASLFDIVRYTVDIYSTPKKALLRLLAEYAQDPREKSLLLIACSRQGAALFNSIRDQLPTLRELLASFPSCGSVPLARLLDVLPPLVPRYYSVTTTPLTNPKQVEFVFNVVEYETPAPRSVKRRGLCTSWLADAIDSKQVGSENGLQMAMFLKQNTGQFMVPANPLSTPTVMIGPGTGVAPFMGFLRHRAALLAADASVQAGELTPWTLYFGCRHSERDFLYKDEIHSFAAESSVLDKLRVCFSRDDAAATIKYVQHMIAEDGEELIKLMATNPSASIFVCGDAKGMARDLQDTFIGLLVKHWHVYNGGDQPLDRIAAVNLLSEWTRQGRYLRDLWA
ncbi:riboflavin synthase domain-like protein, partial [Ramicandelaber brevisporus]